MRNVVASDTTPSGGTADRRAFQVIDLFGARIGLCLPAGVHREVLNRLRPLDPTPASGEPVVRYEPSWEGSSGQYVRYDPQREVTPQLVGATAAEIVDDLHLSIAIHATRGVFVHAGVVAWRGRAILLPGRSCAGKSTLVKALLQAGATYLSDEYAVILPNGNVAPYARPLCLRTATVGGQSLVDPAALGTVAAGAISPGAVLLTTYESGATFTPRAMSPSETVLALLDHTVVAQLDPERALGATAKVARLAPGFRSQRPEAVGIEGDILRLIERSGGATQEAAPDTTPVIELLVCCARKQPSAERVARMRALIGKGMDWTGVFEAAQRNCVVPLLYRNLHTCCARAMPPQELEKLRELARSCSLRSLYLTSQLHMILHWLTARGVSAVPHKGPLLASLAYDDLKLRQFADLDLVVDRSDLEEAKTALKEAGFLLTDDRCEHELTVQGERRVLRHKAHLNFVRPTDSLVVEIHWQFLPSYWSFRMDPEDAARIPTTLWGTAVNSFAIEELLVVLCAHGAKHFWERIQWLSDVAELLDRYRENIDWRRVLAIAERAGARRMLLVGLLLVHEQLDPVVPEEVLQRAGAEPWVRALTDQVCDRLGAGSFQEFHDASLFFMRLRERVRDRIPYLLYYLFLPNRKDRDFAVLPESLSFLYPALRPIRIIFHALRNPSRVVRLLGWRKS